MSFRDSTQAPAEIRPTSSAAYGATPQTANLCSSYSCLSHGASSVYSSHSQESFLPMMDVFERLQNALVASPVERIHQIDNWIDALPEPFLSPGTAALRAPSAPSAPQPTPVAEPAKTTSLCHHRPDPSSGKFYAGFEPDIKSRASKSQHSEEHVSTPTCESEDTKSDFVTWSDIIRRAEAKLKESQDRMNKVFESTLARIEGQDLANWQANLYWVNEQLRATVSVVT